MKNSTLLFLIILSFAVFAQVPQGINYQAIVRDVEGKPLPNGAAVTVEFIIKNAVSGTYNQTQATTVANDFGLVNLIIGLGDETTLAAFDWSKTPCTIEVKANGNSLGTQTMVSVPYAFRCGSVDGGGVSASNGLTKVGDDVQLGGIMTDDVTIDVADYVLDIKGANEIYLNSDIFEIKSKIGSAYVFGDGNSRIFAIGSLSGPASFVYRDGNEGAGKVLTADANGKATWQIPASSPWALNGTNVFRAMGNVGIGINIPNSPLHVLAGPNSVTRPTGVFVDVNQALIDSRAYIRFSQGGSGYENPFYIGTDFDNGINEIWAEDNLPIGFGVGNVERMRIAANGNVGIGVTNPSAKLEVGGDISGTGMLLFSAHAEESTVGGTANYVDFFGASSVVPELEMSNIPVYIPEGTSTLMIKVKGIATANLGMQVFFQLGTTNSTKFNVSTVEGTSSELVLNVGANTGWQDIKMMFSKAGSGSAGVYVKAYSIYVKN